MDKPIRKQLVPPQPEHVRTSVRRWTWVLCFAAFLMLPLVSFFGTFLLERYAGYGIVPADWKNAVFHRIDWWITTYATELTTLIPLFFIFRLIIAQKLSRNGAKARTIHWAGAFALVGLSVPYVCGFSYMPYEFASGARDAGQGIGIFLGIVATPVAGLLALVGWLVGSELSTWRAA